MKYNRIVVDAMGGDNAPEEIVNGAIAACQESSTLQCLLVGDEFKINPLLRNGKIESDRCEIVHTTDMISPEDSPKEAIQNKPDASVNVAARLLRDNHGDGMISAGNTAATILASARVIPRMAGIERGALAAILPAMKNNPGDPGVTIMLDVGATLHCTVNQLVSFGIMGIHYGQEILGIKNPRVGLLNIGEEETKGHDILIETNRTLRHTPNLHFIGNIEGRDILRGIADVIVTEGYIGNVTLKSLEGMAEMTMLTGKQIWRSNIRSKLALSILSPVIKKLKKRMDYSEYGGAPILGFQHLIIKAHGRSKAKAIKNAVLLAEKSIDNNLIGHMEDAMKEYYMSLFEHKHDRKDEEKTAED